MVTEKREYEGKSVKTQFWRFWAKCTLSSKPPLLLFNDRILTQVDCWWTKTIFTFREHFDSSPGWWTWFSTGSTPSTSTLTFCKRCGHQIHHLPQNIQKRRGFLWYTTCRYASGFCINFTVLNGNAWIFNCLKNECWLWRTRLVNKNRLRSGPCLFSLVTLVFNKKPGGISIWCLHGETRAFARRASPMAHTVYTTTPTSYPARRFAGHQPTSPPSQSEECFPVMNIFEVRLLTYWAIKLDHADSCFHHSTVWDKHNWRSCKFWVFSFSRLPLCDRQVF